MWVMLHASVSHHQGCANQPPSPLHHGTVHPRMFPRLMHSRPFRKFQDRSFRFGIQLLTSRDSQKICACREQMSEKPTSSTFQWYSSVPILCSYNIYTLNCRQSRNYLNNNPAYKHRTRDSQKLSACSIADVIRIHQS